MVVGDDVAEGSSEQDTVTKSVFVADELLDFVVTDRPVVGASIKLDAIDATDAG
jgi:hypothetical protein